MGRTEKLLCALTATLILALSTVLADASQNENVTIYRDDYGVPHVVAESNRGVFYGAGYAIAQDRLRQIHQLRLLAQGRLAEAAGPEYLNSDIQVRRNLGGLPQAELAFSRIGPPYREWIQAYCDGINRFIEDARMSAMAPPWTPADIVTTERYLIWMFSQGKSAELERMATLNYLSEKFDSETARAIWQDLMSPTAPDAITTIRDSVDGKQTGLQSQEDAALCALLDEGIIALSLSVRDSSPAPELFSATSPRSRLGSNAIVVASNRSATGKPLLVSNTQLEVEFPAVYYEQHLRGGDFDVMGFTVPGFPPVGFGHNQNMAWTITVGCSDQQDIYEETVRLGPGKRLQYLFQGEWLDCLSRKEEIIVRGYPEPVLLTVYSTIHGPIEILDIENGRAYTTRWGPYLDGHTLMAYFDMNRAKTIDDFAAALSRVEMSFNFLYADTDGNIAYWHAGELPQRAKGHTGVLPASGLGDFEWQGFVPFEQLPRYINPPEGIILLENNKPAPWSPDYDGSLTGWGTQRMERMKQLSDKLPENLTLNDLEAALEDTRYLAADKLKPELLRVCRTAEDERIRRAATFLEAWDNTVTADSVGMTVFFVWLQKLGRNMLMDEFGEHCIPSLVEKPHLPLIFHAFEGENSLLPPSRDYFDDITTRKRESKDDIIAKSLLDALDECERRFGTPQMEQWQWEKLSYWDLGPLGRVVNTFMDPNRHHVDVVGGGASSQLMEVENGFPNARNLMPPGNSGNPASPNASDQLNLFVGFDYKPMPFDTETIQRNATSKLVLELK